MSRLTSLEHEFVEFIPDQIQEGRLYISLRFVVAIHKCFCGCGMEVATPLDPTDWKLIFDGKTVSLYPSVGNWSFDCQSHYWIENNKIVWAKKWTKEQIVANRAYDRRRKGILDVDSSTKKRNWILRLFFWWK